MNIHLPKLAAISISLLSISTASLANSEEKEIQDMSDPLAVYSTAGAGITDKGINIKLGQSYDTGNPATMGMHLLEVKGVGGEALGLRDTNSAVFDSVDNSIDSFRYRHFGVNLPTMVGRQLDMSYDVEADLLSTSYSFIKALPSFGPITLYPLAGAGINVQNGIQVDQQTGKEVKTGYYIPGTYGVIGMYSKLDITDKIWFNYNPMYMSSISGSDKHMEEGFGGDGDIITHEVSLSYQLSPRANIRYFANWNDELSFSDGDHRVEVNYQF